MAKPGDAIYIGIGWQIEAGKKLRQTSKDRLLFLERKNI